MATSNLMERINAHQPKTSQRVTRRGRVIHFPGNWQTINRGTTKSAPPEYRLPRIPAAYANTSPAGEEGG